jgi:hypothetical protein
MMGMASSAGHACRVALLHQLGCVGAVDIVHRDPQLAVVFASVMYSDDVGMPYTCGQVGFADEPFPERGVAGDVGAKNLEGIVAGQTRMLHQVDLAHSPRAEQT